MRKYLWWICRCSYYAVGRAQNASHVGSTGNALIHISGIDSYGCRARPVTICPRHYKGSVRSIRQKACVHCLLELCLGRCGYPQEGQFSLVPMNGLSDRQCQYPETRSRYRRLSAPKEPIGLIWQELYIRSKIKLFQQEGYSTQRGYVVRDES